ncbi:GyrI-like domain-containing protein [Paenibacillus sp. KQZ6P-2]|uniref:GyrI-like domain-containing protein n=1 Tax=Paenibacillus mangrovi TaxID=2931978 RepID=A0A9X1WSH8_9BACL|nr:GyrI-like domain-containing protein [Paenibacillus mangrovi]MCJ8014198.1 GyrI-like domain-containing protein [Paenibacillus mangrovi]
MMEPVIRKERKAFTLFGCSKAHDPGKPYSETIFELFDQVWREVRSKELSHRGINHVVYDQGNLVFAGIELMTPLKEDSILKKKDVVFEKYAYGKHIGPYSELDTTYQSIRALVQAAGEQHGLPLMEMYGHWHEDESKLETEIFYNLI